MRAKEEGRKIREAVWAAGGVVMGAEALSPVLGIFAGGCGCCWEKAIRPEVVEWTKASDGTSVMARLESWKCVAGTVSPAERKAWANWRKRALQASCDGDFLQQGRLRYY
jgi:hypothetical protein